MFTRISLSPKSFFWILFVFVCTSVQAQWSTAKLSQGRSRAYPIVVGRKAFFIGGEIQNSSGNNSNTVDIYNDSTGTWADSNPNRSGSGKFMVAK